MPEQRPALAELDWQEIAPWLCLVRVFRLALDLRKLVLAAAAILLTVGGWWVIGWVGSGSDEVQQRIESEPPAPWNEPSGERELALPWGGDDRGPLAAIELNTTWFIRNPVVDSWRWLSRPYRQLFRVDSSITGFVYSLVCSLWVAVVWAFFGGAITRIAALELAREDRAGMGEALRHARTKLFAYFWGPLYPLVGAALVALPMIFLGWMLRFDFGVLLGAIIWPIFLVCGLLMTIIVVGVLFGWPLMWATVSVESTDTFDAMSRAYAYVLQRPLHYLFYALVATVLGFLGWIVVAVFAAAVVHLSFWGVSWTSGGPAATDLVNRLPVTVRMFAWENDRDVEVDTPPAENGGEEFEGPVLLAPAEAEDGSNVQEPKTGEAEAGADSAETQSGEAEAGADSAETQSDEASGALERAGLIVLTFWVGLVKLLALGFSFSYFWTASTAIYFLMRRDVDATEMDEVYVEDEEESYTLPSLSSDTEGAPVADNREQPSRQTDAQTDEASAGEGPGDTSEDDGPSSSDDD